MGYEIFIEPEAIEDIQLAIAWYEEQSFGLGIRFQNVIEEHLKRIGVNPFFQIRYDNVRCLPLLNSIYDSLHSGRRKIYCYSQSCF